MTSKEKRVKRETSKLVVLNEEELIRQVELRPILYDKSLKGYRKSALRLQYWKEVSEVIGARVEECRRRWRSLRDAFSKHYKYLNRIEDATQSKRKKWVFYDQMNFIAPFLDSSYCEIEDALLEDFPDNSDDGHSLILHETNENCDLTSLDTIESTNRQQLKIEENANVKDLQHSTAIGDESQFTRITSIIDQSTASAAQTILMHHPLQIQNENNKKDNSCAILSPPLHQTEVLPSSSSLSATSSMAMCLDSDEKFLLSCAPILRRLTHRKNALARLKIQQILYEIEFESEGR